MFESQLEKWIVSHAGNQLPISVVLPSGQLIELSPDPKVVIHIKDMTGARLLFNPTLANLGTGYVEGHLDIDGKVDHLIDVAVSLAKTTDSEDFTEPDVGLMGACSHTVKKETGSRSSITTTSQMTSTSCF